MDVEVRQTEVLLPDAWLVDDICKLNALEVSGKEQ